jgi:hypothetical protein
MFMKRLKEYRKSGDLSDLTVEVDKQLFRLHKLIMASSSEYFSCLVRSEMADSNNVSLLELPGGEHSMELVADFCYEIPIRHKLTVENIGHMVCASHYLQIDSLQAECLQVLATLASESVSNCCRILSNCKDVEPTAKEIGVIDCCVQTLLHCWIGPMPFIQENGFDHENTSAIVQSWANELRHVPFPIIVTIIEKQSIDFLANLTSNKTLLELPVGLTDQLLSLQSSEYCLSPSEFLSLYRSSSSIPRTSYDAVYQAVEKLIERYGMTLESNTMIQEIDFKKLSLEALERAAGNGYIPQQVVMKATLSICKDQRKQLEKSQQLNTSLQQQLTESEDFYNTIRRQLKKSEKLNKKLKRELKDSEDCNKHIEKQLNSCQKEYKTLLSKTSHFKEAFFPYQQY